MLKYIDVLINGAFAFRTVNHTTVKSAIEEVKRMNGCPLLGITLSAHDKVTAHFTKDN